MTIITIRWFTDLNCSVNASVEMFTSGTPETGADTPYVVGTSGPTGGNTYHCVDSCVGGVRKGNQCMFPPL